MLPLAGRRLLKTVLHTTPLHKLAYYVPRLYASLYPPRVLSYLCDCLDRTRATRGAVVELGCAEGDTTVWLNRHMDSAGIEKPYFAVDTFAGFTDADIAHERHERAKHEEPYHVDFRLNDVRWFMATLRVNGITRVTPIEADVALVDWCRIGEVSFALVDVDLYMPTRRALEGVYEQVRPGGMVVVDDCVADHRYDGSLGAYLEFTSARGLQPRIALDRLGIIEVGPAGG